MKNTIVLFTVLLVLWIAGSSWYYVCKVRMDCNAADMGTDQLAVITPGALIASDSAETNLSLPPEYTFWFNSGSNICELSSNDKDHFLLIKQYVTENPGCHIMITGFADNTGSESLNLRISSQRAEFIRQQLLDTGVPTGIIESSGKGELEPVADNTSIEGRAKNRRVEIQTLKN
jgi:outer membrane protein OmpA-like peptidoglycan-associated protein